MSTLRKKILTDQNALNTLSAVYDVMDKRSVRLMVHFKAGTTAGQVVLEAAPTADFAGTWKQVGAITWSAADSLDTYPPPAQNTQTADAPPWGYVRARISTGIVAGNVDAWLLAN